MRVQFAPKSPKLMASVRIQGHNAMRGWKGHVSGRLGMRSLNFVLLMFTSLACFGA